MMQPAIQISSRRRERTRVCESLFRQQIMSSQQMRQGNSAKPAAKAPKEFPAGQLSKKWISFLHSRAVCELTQFRNINSLLFRIIRHAFASPLLLAYASTNFNS